MCWVVSVWSAPVTISAVSLLHALIHVMLLYRWETEIAANLKAESLYR